MFFNPLSLLLLFFLFIGLVLAFFLINIGLVTIAFEKIGLSPLQVFVFLLASLLGSSINIPIKRIPRPFDDPPEAVRIFGVLYRIPRRHHHETVIAMNLGGAVLPVLLSISLIFKHGIFTEPLAGVAIVAAITYHLARPVSGIGIAIPLIVPPLFAVLAAMALAPENLRPAIAYVSGTVGTLIGADLLHLSDVPRLNAPLVSIGGAGTFDGIFLTGIIAVLLA
ncbi:MAG: DUF1614 domain-containing protein [Deltaproteobacteria bacterium]